MQAGWHNVGLNRRDERRRVSSASPPARADSVSPADPGRTVKSREQSQDTISQISPNTAAAPIHRVG